MAVLEYDSWLEDFLQFSRLPFDRDLRGVYRNAIRVISARPLTQEEREDYAYLR